MNSTPEVAWLQPRRLLIGSLAGLALLFGAASFAPTQASEALIYAFKGGSDGVRPIRALVADAKGALYGTTFEGGLNNGTAFKLTPPTLRGGQWTETVLYRFKGGSDGSQPASNLIFDTQGALYGTTYHGGKPGNGIVFKLTPPAVSGGQWTETVLYSFKGAPSDGASPSAGLVLDAKGVLYGATEGGGSFNSGTAFKLTPPSSGKGPWTETVLYNFDRGKDAMSPSSPLIFDKEGALYGTTQFGKSFLPGTVFKLTPQSSGKGPWTMTVLHAFNGGADGATPLSALTFDKQGALYGTTTSGGASSNGTVFKLTPPALGKGPWTETILTDFAGASVGGPYSTPLFDAKGSLYGTTAGVYGSSTVGGSVFKLTPPASGKAGKWTLTVLQRFGTTDNDKGGSFPYAGVIFGRDGALYGTLSEGAAGEYSSVGGVYRLQP